MIRRTFDPTFLNGVANHPQVRPGLLFGDGTLDLTPLVAQSFNFTLQNDQGGFVLTAQESGVYEVHSLFLPGSGAIRAMHEAMEWMFTRTDCHTITSKVPGSNKSAKGFALAGGLRTVFERDDAQIGPCEYVELTLMDWAMRTKALEVHGERFHAFIEEHAKRLGWPDHPHDPPHERAAGAALLMIERGRALKGVSFYNRWARLAGYPSVTLVSDAPPVVDMSVGDIACVVGIGADGMEALLCR